MSARDPDRLWSSRHSGASSIRGTLYMLGFGALWALVYVLTGWLVGMILGTLSVFIAVVWFLGSRKEIVDYARTRPVLRLVLGVIFLAIGLGLLAAVPVMWKSVQDPSRLSARARANPYLPIGVAIVVGLACLASGSVLVAKALGRRRR